MVKVKICGITNLQDAIWAVSLGAEYLGFNFYSRSPRKISYKLAEQIICKLPPISEPAGVFVNEEIDVVLNTVKKCQLKLVQLHGKEQPEYCESLRSRLSCSAQDSGLKIIKAFRVKGKGSLKNLVRYKDMVDYFLLDAYVAGVEGGTGVPMSRDNWDIAQEAKRYGKPIFLAGGLTDENVGEAVKTAGPYAVDAASGVERLPRRKDYDKLKNFIMNAKSVEPHG